MAVKMLTWPGMTSSRAAVYPTPPPPQTPPSPSFHLFPSLPIELRLKIWAFALNDLQPRILPIQPLSQTPPATPSLLQTNPESRFEAQRRYKKHCAHPAIGERSYYINYSIDTLYINNSLGFRANATMHQAWLKPVRHLAIEFGQFALLTSFWLEEGLWSLLKWYTPELETLFVVVGEKRRRDGKQVSFLEVSGEEAYMEFLGREERRQLVEGGRSFEKVKAEGEWRGLKLKWVREGEEGEKGRGLRVGAWGSVDWKS
ncbi:uncharacterized protein LY89DRAFT_665108 [Mollisia scopiformis]|uniref:2EXR domain-containing protein n=1 Tax=Mollisia scopiformis TaxID=149040 RepID=A0A194XPG1_MOLSC|nr:uncharacterized protein LY89DRAFT_665108 [Mollisia scopiformis]KUJ21959.1 hypothetical protein LY89DRAFT_665108 [Mollisia scopiformis]